MNAIILAAGRGSRMGRSTENSHKCLTILNNKTLLEWQQESLRQAGVDNITVVRGYRSEMIQGNFRTIENPRWAETNMVATLFCAPKFEEDIIISYSDIVYSSRHVKDLVEKEGDIVITADKDWLSLWSSRFTNPFEDAETFKTEGDRLTVIGGKSNRLENIEAQYMGLLKFSPKGWKIAYELFNSMDGVKQDKLDMTSLLSMLINQTDIKAVIVEGKWCEVDCYNDVITYENLLDESNNWSHDWR
jgi:L-glutamine-phosphate cytidylyltransferase